jgi:dTDP-4-dehydrorhamnose reductase
VEIENVVDHEADLREPSAVEELINEVHPTHVVHCAAMTNVDECEKNWSEAYALNVRATMEIARRVKELGGITIYLSTDLVFGGERGNYREVDVTIPLSNYGWTKLMGESHVFRTSGDNSVLRCALIYGKGHEERQGFLGWMTRTLEEGKPLYLYQDEYRSPLLLDDLASAVAEVIEKKFTGLYHIAGRERMNRYDFGVRFANTFGLNTDLVEPVSIEDHKGTRRPQDVSLNIDHASGVFETDFETVRTGLKRLRKEWDTE